MSEATPERVVEETHTEDTRTETTPVEPEHVGDSTVDNPDEG